MSIRIGILGYGNLGRGVECALKQNRTWSLSPSLRGATRNRQGSDGRRPGLPRGAGRANGGQN